MRVLLNFKNRLIFTNPFIVFRKNRPLTTVTFIVDTGSPFTILNYADAHKLRIPINQLKPSEGPVGLGGQTLDLRSFDEQVSFKLIANNKENKEERIDLPINKVLVGLPVKGQGNTPSLLGNDFLEENRLKLVFDPANNNAFAEKD